uniref:Uncharacterized protein n=1 Tax=Clastoptera arizonana TaxID=38151 RepID=A0A1B6DLX5_9HEMI
MLSLRNNIIELVSTNSVECKNCITLCEAYQPADVKVLIPADCKSGNQLIAHNGVRPRSEHRSVYVCSGPPPYCVQLYTNGHRVLETAWSEIHRASIFDRKLREVLLQ